jgi:selenocysteine lyase/cysteine desulfurase
LNYALRYKFFGSHAGILYGKYELLDGLFAYKVRPAPNELPWRFETGTQNHEGIAGVLGALEYLKWGVAERVPTCAFTLPGWHPHRLAEALAARGISVWDGNYYAIHVTDRPRVEAQGGMLRVGPVHYNTLEEVGRLQEALRGLV